MRERVEIFKALLKPLRQGRLLDLATGHGTFALAAHEMGWDITAVDVRTNRMPSVPGIKWVEADVRDLDPSGYDCVANLGLLYHLELSAQLDLLKRCAGTAMILDTHVSLTPEVMEEGYEGSYFDELAGRTENEWRNSGTASWGNTSSFWATEASLERMLHDCGYGFVYTLRPWYLPDRTFWLCL